MPLSGAFGSAVVIGMSAGSLALAVTMAWALTKPLAPVDAELGAGPLLPPAALLELLPDPLDLHAASVKVALAIMAAIAMVRRFIETPREYGDGRRRAMRAYSS
jgi:hypothetical protein